MAGSLNPDDSAMHEGKLRFPRLSRLLICGSQRVLRNLFDAYHCPPSIDCSESFDTHLFFKWNHSREQRSLPGFDNVCLGHSREQCSLQRLLDLFADHSREQRSSLGFDGLFPGHSREQRSSPGFDNVCPGHSREQRSSDGKRIVQEDDMEGVGGKSSSQPSWLLLSPEGTSVSSSSDIAGEEAQPPVLIEGYTQTDSLGLIQEYKDVTVQTDPIHLDEKETLEKGIAEFKRDRAERQLRKSRLSQQDLHVFKTRQKGSTAEQHETDDWYGGVKGESLLTVENDEKHYGAGSIRDLKDVEEEQQESYETDDWYGGVKGVSGLTDSTALDSLKAIKETDDAAGDADTVWTSKGERPKTVSPLHDDDDDDGDGYNVSGVDPSFLARHSRDASLISLLSRERGHSHHPPSLYGIHSDGLTISTCRSQSNGMSHVELPQPTSQLDSEISSIQDIDSLSDDDSYKTANSSLEMNPLGQDEDEAEEEGNASVGSEELEFFDAGAEVRDDNVPAESLEFPHLQEGIPEAVENLSYYHFTYT